MTARTSVLVFLGRNIVIFELGHFIIEAGFKIEVTLAGSAGRKWHVGFCQIQLRNIDVTGQTVVLVLRGQVIEVDRKIAQNSLLALLWKRIHVALGQARARTRVADGTDNGRRTTKQ